MLYKTAISILMFAGLLALALIGSPDEDDAVLQSFDRELNHEPVPTARSERSSIDGDELYRTINSIHWTSDQGAESEPDRSDTGDGQ